MAPQDVWPSSATGLICAESDGTSVGEVRLLVQRIWVGGNKSSVGVKAGSKVQGIQHLNV